MHQPKNVKTDATRSIEAAKDVQQLSEQFPDILFENSPDSNFNGSNGTWIGVEKNGFFITNPFESECGRFTVDPMQTYGIPMSAATQIVRINKNRM